MLDSLLLIFCSFYLCRKYYVLTKNHVLRLFGVKYFARGGSVKNLSCDIRLLESLFSAAVTTNLLVRRVVGEMRCFRTSRGGSRQETEKF